VRGDSRLVVTHSSTGTREPQTKASGACATSPPWKVALVTWLTIFSLITVIVRLTGPLLEDLPLVVRLGITTVIAVPLMTWVVMPRVTRLLRRWLY
jgi:antibiotic biosynthesis monooxygenase (ABM) superfamily enzyme